MAVMDSALTSLASAKDIAGVPSSNTTDDSLFERLINAMSMAASVYCSRIFKYDTYTEIISPPNRQLLLVKEWPIASVTSITDNGYPLVLNTDYRCDAQDASKGEVYKENGWMGSELVTGLTLDPVASARYLTVVYIAGYHLPSDPLYVVGDPASLPLDITEVVDELVAKKYYMIKRKTHGVMQLKESEVMYRLMGPGDSIDLSGDDPYSMALNKYRRWL